MCVCFANFTTAITHNTTTQKHKHITKQIDQLKLTCSFDALALSDAPLVVHLDGLLLQVRVFQL
jgi:hypothetical protein